MSDSGLVPWLLAQIEADEEAVRRDFAGETWHTWFSAEDGESWTPPGTDMPFDCGIRVTYDDDSPAEVVMRSWYDMMVIHAVNWGPSRVLAECAAKRKIIEAHTEDYWQLYETRPVVCVICGPEYPCPTLRLLAEPYRSAPGFDPLWLPT